MVKSFLFLAWKPSKARRMPLLSLSSFSLIFFFSFLFDKGATLCILHLVRRAIPHGWRNKKLQIIPTNENTEPQRKQIHPHDPLL